MVRKITNMLDWMTTDEACALSGYHIVYMRRLIRGQKIEAEKKGGAWWVNRQSLEAYMKEAATAKDKRLGAKRKPSTS